jgi:hypothetical protein
MKLQNPINRLAVVASNRANVHCIKLVIPDTSKEMYLKLN